MKTLNAVVAGWAAIVTLVLAAATPAAAQIPGESELMALMAKNKPYQEMLVEGQDIFLMSISHINAAFEHSEAPLSKTEAQTWSSAWETKARARLSAVKERLAKTPRITAEEVRELLGAEGGKGLADTLARNPKLVEDSLAAAERTLNQTAALAPLSAAGDAAATDKLAREMLAVSLYMVEIENQALRMAIATVDEAHPQVSLAQSALATNLAAAEIQRVILRAYNGEPPETESAARRARAHLIEAEAAAKRIPSKATAMIARLERAAPEDGKPLLEKMRKAFATYEESATVELEGLRSLNEAVSALAADDLEAVAAALGKLETAFERRIPLQLERASYLSQ